MRGFQMKGLPHETRSFSNLRCICIFDGCLGRDWRSRLTPSYHNVAVPLSEGQGDGLVTRGPCHNRDCCKQHFQITPERQGFVIAGVIISPVREFSFIAG